MGFVEGGSRSGVSRCMVKVVAMITLLPVLVIVVIMSFIEYCDRNIHTLAFLPAGIAKLVETVWEGKRGQYMNQPLLLSCKTA